MEKDAVQESGLAPPQGGEGAASPQEAPEKQGKEDASSQELGRLHRDIRTWKEKYRQLQAQQAQMEERDKQLQDLKSRLEGAHLARLLTEAAQAQDAINPTQVAAFLRKRVALGEDFKPEVVAAEGKQAEAGNASPATVEELVSQFLSRYPYHRKAKLSGGSGSAPSPSALTDTLEEQIKGATSHEELEKIISKKRPG